CLLQQGTSVGVRIGSPQYRQLTARGQLFLVAFAYSTITGCAFFRMRYCEPLDPNPAALLT
ncbi:hypothetical protein FS749_014283, partial [Ceratobasidium sp. UAMH 11750]